MLGAASTAALTASYLQISAVQRNSPSGILPLLTARPRDPTTLTSSLNPGNPSRNSSSQIFLDSLPRRAAGAVDHLPDEV